MKKDIEKALKEFLMDVRTTGEERKKGIPLITFVYKEEDKAVLLKALPLPLADIQLEEKIPAGKELLYRVDFFKEGEAKVSFGVLPAIKEPTTFLTLLDNAIKTGDRKAGYQGLCDYLKLHNALCGLEALAEGENIEELTGGYGSPGAGSLTPEEAERLNLGGDVGSQAVKNALARLGKPYSQAKRDSGDYYDCSSLTYYAYKEAGINLSYHGSNTAASQGQLLSDRGCEVDYEDIQPGDLIFYSFTRNGRYKNISHVAVYAGNGYLVDASSSKGYVVFRPVYSTGKIVMCGRPSWL